MARNKRKKESEGYLELVDLFKKLRSRLRRGISLPSQMRLANGIFIDRNMQVRVWRRGMTKEKVYENINDFFANCRLSRGEVKQAMGNLSDYRLVLKLDEGKLQAGDIVKCRNQEIRSFLLSQYGVEKFMKAMEAEVLHQEGDKELLRFQWENGGEAIVMVKVIDSSTQDVYLLRVPPDIRRCRQAVAWTFGMSENDYDPLQEA